MKRFKVCCFLICFFILCHMACPLVSYAEEAVCINPLRYDYSSSLYWGYSTTWNDDDLDATFQKFQDMPQSELQDMYDHPENWGKGWILFNVSPSWVDGVGNLGYNEIPEALKEIIGKYSDRGLLYYGNMSIENIRIGNSNEIGIYPYYYMQVLYNEDPDTDNSMISNEWVLEYVYKKADNPDDILEEKMRDICLYADVYVLQSDGFYTYKDVEISLNNIKKAQPLNKAAVSVRLNKAELCTEDDDPNLDTAYDIIYVDDELDRDTDDLPSYLYALELDISINDDISVTPYDYEEQPIEELVSIAHAHGVRILIDGAQSVAHIPVNVTALDTDFFVFSGHKIFAPTGIGAVYGKSDVLEAARPYHGGGNMIKDVTFERTIYNPAPNKFEAGTGSIADAVGLGAALEYLNSIGMAEVNRHEHELLVYAMKEMQKINGLHLIGTATNKASVLSFVLDGVDNEAVGQRLNELGIAVRTGHHCAQPILRHFGLEGTVRPTLALYNSFGDIDRLVQGIRTLA